MNQTLLDQAPPASSPDVPPHSSRARRLMVTAFLPLCLLLASCASSVGVVEKRRSIAYDELPKSALNSKGFSSSTEHILRERDLASPSRSDPAKSIAALDAASDTPVDDTSLRLAQAELCLREARAAKTTQSDAALGWYLAAAEHAYPAALAQTSAPNDETLTAIYNHSAGQVAAIVFDRKHDFTRPAAIAASERTYTLSTDLDGPALVDPSLFDYLVPADQLVIRGIRTHVVEKGIGAPLACHKGRTPQSSERDPFLAPAGMAQPVTATLEFDRDSRVALRFHDVLEQDTAQLGDQKVQLAADFTAPLGAIMTLAHAQTKLKMKALLHPEEFASRTGLYFLEPFRTDRIPVVLVHGLMSDPATWLNTYNELKADPVIRENFQFWYFVYPTGNPVGQSGAALRSELAQFESFYPDQSGRGVFNNMVLVGHSMGGLVSDLQIRDGGDKLWHTMSEHSIEELNLDEKTREMFRQSAYFKANPHITRVIFASSPHRGSEIANMPLVEFATKLINAPLTVVQKNLPELVSQMTSAGKSVFQAGFNGVATLRINDPRLLALLEQPMSPRVTYHSIIGNRGKPGPLEESSDGIVPYVSSHLDGAASEKIVPSGHGSHAHPEGVAEIRRILLQHIGK